MKRISKKEFKSLLKSIACALVTCTNHHLINDDEWVSTIWHNIAVCALLDYPQDDLATWKMRYNYLHDLCNTI